MIQMSKATCTDLSVNLYRRIFIIGIRGQTYKKLAKTKSVFGTIFIKMCTFTTQIRIIHNFNKLVLFLS